MIRLINHLFLDSKCLYHIGYYLFADIDPTVSAILYIIIFLLTLFLAVL